MAEQTVTVGVGALSIEDVIAVARGGAKVAISDESKHEMALSRAVIDHLADDTVPHYGISTGFGALASTSIPKEQRAQLQKSLIRSHAAGAGPEVEREVVRDYNDFPIAGLALTFVSGSLRPEQERSLKTKLRLAGAELSRRLGAVGSLT